MDRTLPPLNERGLALPMSKFLRLVGFGNADRALLTLLELNHIRHWGFFQRASIQQLRRRGFPLPIAGQLIDGAHALEYQFIQVSSPTRDGVSCSPEI
ncbi:hypothetical protein PCANC_27876 [Puccinia coronata f. sp. avenae]|uniref:Uncharacterized protein n=1 Tax=Puccinia coronata f. sp. avenae TaxID=200324 RepID=A0A2N5TEI9_9BASI|nr:hypothetical protein PCANC_27876 [Puccinia coronata f. sp. avenae]